jgi:hypothetical protein
MINCQRVSAVVALISILSLLRPPSKSVGAADTLCWLLPVPPKNASGRADQR